MTLLSAVFASPSRVRLAHARKFRCTTERYQCDAAAGMYADVATLKAARELGIMQYTPAVMVGLHAAMSLLLCGSCVLKAAAWRAKCSV
jgi:hypothetical protein